MSSLSSCQQPITLSHQPSSATTSAMMAPTYSTTTTSSSSMASCNFMDMNLTSPTSSSSSSSCGMDGDNMLSADLTMILNNIMKVHTEDQGMANLEVMQSNNNSNNNNNLDMMNPTSSNSNNTSISHTACASQVTPLQSSSSIDQATDCCGMYPGQAVCRSKHSASGPGESVLITISSLPSISSSTLSFQDKITTRIVTCYCSGHCLCLGCLVHPVGSGENIPTYNNGGGSGGNNNAMVDGYQPPVPPPPLSLSTCPSYSSTTSSIYSTSDDEDHHQHQHPNQRFSLDEGTPIPPLPLV
ncbi:hypothetical protein BCR42DRAFT_409460 [Absidia repens]|uniref:Copper-fist domain-containing protein n=1 Tax=Absidia repens TaxID=90262 RepID=A0A1X2IR53_9FUNG|nr:hypothetical protein BCR42DRAFT_409460 [Absidia repens]